MIILLTKILALKTGAILSGKQTILKQKTV